MTLKRVICAVMATIMMTLFAVNVVAASSVNASVATNSAAQGELVTVYIYMSDDTGIASGTVLLYYSTDQLAYVSSQVNSSYASSAASVDSMVLITISNQTGSTISGTLATLTFVAIGDAYTQCYINVSASNCLDFSGNSVTVNSSTTVLVIEDADGNTEATVTDDENEGDDVELSDEDDEVIIDDEDETPVTEATTTAATTTQATTTASTTTKATTTTVTTTTAATTTTTQETTTETTTTTQETTTIETTTEATTSEEIVSSDAAVTLVSSDETEAFATIEDADDNDSSKASAQTIAIVIVVLVLTIAGVTVLELYRRK